MESVADVELMVTDRVERALRRDIQTVWRRGGAVLPKQIELVRRYGASLRSVRDAMERLKRENLIRSVRGKGTFVLDASISLRDVLVVCDTYYHPYQVLCVGAITRTLKEREYTTSLVTTHDPAADWKGILGGHRQACGAVLISRYSREAVAQLTADGSIPIITVSDLAEPVRGPALCDAVLPDTRAMGYRCVEHLVQRGHRRIALLGWELSRAGGREALEGYRDGLRAFGLDYVSDYVVELPSLPFEAGRPATPLPIPIEQVRQRFDALFESDRMPTALIHGAGSEIHVRDLVEHGLRNHIKGEAVIGYLAREQLDTGYPGLGEARAICTSIERVVARAIELLLRPRRVGEPPRREIIDECALFERRDGIWREA